MVTQVDVGHARGWLSPAAAASLARIDARLGAPMRTSELGRTSERAQYLWDLYFYPDGSVRPASTRPTWLGRPGRPETSPHVQGNAADSDHWPGWEAEYGWIEDVAGEPWHRRYVAARDTHHNEGPDMPLNAETDYDAFKQMLHRALKWDVRDGDAPGADWTLGRTLWDRLGAIETAIKSGAVTIDYDKLAASLAEQGVAREVADELARRLAPSK